MENILLFDKKYLSKVPEITKRITSMHFESLYKLAQLFEDASKKSWKIDNLLFRITLVLIHHDTSQQGKQCSKPAPQPQRLFPWNNQATTGTAPPIPIQSKCSMDHLRRTYRAASVRTEPCGSILTSKLRIIRLWSAWLQPDRQHLSFLFAQKNGQ